MKLSRSSVLILGAWVFFVGGYTAASLLLPHGSRLTTLSDLTEAFVALFANTCLLWNAASPYRRRNAFWMLLAFGCTLWLAGQLFWTYRSSYCTGRFRALSPAIFSFSFTPCRSWRRWRSCPTPERCAKRSASAFS